MKPGIQIALFTLLAALLSGCNQSPTEAPDPVKPGPGKTDSLPVDPWSNPYLPLGIHDTDLAGDFSPVEEGHTWIYHEWISDLRSLRAFAIVTDTETVAKVTIRIVHVQPTDSGRLVRVRTERQVVSIRCFHWKFGKKWTWDEPPAGGGFSIRERLFLEKGDVFFVLGDDGKWKPSDGGYGPFLHRFPKRVLSDGTERGAPDSVAFGYTTGLGTLCYARGYGLFYRDSATGSPGRWSPTLRANLVAYNGILLNDSLDKEFSRPLVPKDPGTGILTLEEVLKSLPVGFCDGPAPIMAPDPDRDLFDYSGIRTGNTWEYLQTDSTIVTGKGFGRSWNYGGLATLSIGETRAAGSCLAFFLLEKDSGRLHEVRANGFAPVVTPQVSNYATVGIKRGSSVYRWERSGEAVNLDTARTGISIQGIWPFTSGKAPFGIGYDSSDFSRKASLKYQTVGAQTFLVYTRSSVDVNERGFSVAKGLGLISAHIFESASSSSTSDYRVELFRYNGDVLDAGVQKRYENLGP